MHRKGYDNERERERERKSSIERERSRSTPTKKTETTSKEVTRAVVDGKNHMIKHLSREERKKGSSGHRARSEACCLHDANQKKDYQRWGKNTLL